MEEKRTPPILAMNRLETEAYDDMAASLRLLMSVDGTMRQRMRLIRNGYRDYRGACAGLRRLMQAMSETIPEEKRRQLRRHADMVRIKRIYGPEASKDPEMHLVLTEDFAVIVYAAFEGCRTCMGTAQDCGRCQLGRALDHVSFLSRGDRAWWEIAAAKMNEETT